MLGVKENRVIVKGKFAKEVRKAAGRSALCLASNSGNKATDRNKSVDSGFRFEWK